MCVCVSIDTDNNDTSMTGDPFFFFFLFFMPSLFPFLFHDTVHHIMSQWLLLCFVVLVAAVVVAPFKSKVFYVPCDRCMGSTIQWIHRLLINICTNTQSLPQMKWNVILPRRCFSFEFFNSKRKKNKIEIFFFLPNVTHMCTKAAHTMHQKIVERLYVAHLEQSKLMAILFIIQNS